MPAVLKQLMLHASIGTTMSFYVEYNADDVSAELLPWAGNTLGNTSPKMETAVSITAEETSVKSMISHD